MSLPETRSEPWTVVLADDHDLVLEAVTGALRRLGRFEILARVGDGTSAFEAIVHHVPDLAVLDNSMPGLSGLEVARKLHEEGRRSTRIILLTMFGHAHLVSQAHRFGVSACVSKEDASSELVRAIESAKAGRFFLSPKMDEEYRSTATKPDETLTPRESEILAAIVDGMTTKEIADLLGISVRTVDHHRERLMRKIGAHNAADVVRYATRMGLRFKR